MTYRPFLPLLFLCLFLLTGGSARAGEAGPHLELKAGMALTGRFVHEHPVQGFDKPLASEGTFLLAPAQAMRWQIEKPMATTTLVDASGLRQSIGNFVLIKMTPTQMPFLSEVQAQLIAALNGDWKKVEKDFIVKRSGSASAWTVTLVPRVAGRAPFLRLVATGGRFVDRVRIDMRQGSDTIVFSGQSVGKAAP